MTGDLTVSPVEWLLDEVAIIAAHHDSESELGAAALATNAVLAPLPADAADRRRLSCRVTALAREHASVFRTADEDLPDVRSMGRRLVLHEGYRVSPSSEGSDVIERLRQQWGARLIATTPDVWSRWGEKAAFRRQAQEVFGGHAAPPGHERRLDSISAVRELVSLANQNSSMHTRVLKAPGTGGAGNLVLPAGVKVTSEEVQGLVLSTDAEREVVIEEWLEWNLSLCVSFLIRPGSLPTFVAATEQVVDGSRAKFIGSNSHTRLPEADLASVVAATELLAEAMAVQGVLGVVAIDVIVGDGRGWGDSGMSLPSGSRMCLIECNPRLNRHNRVGMLVERLARVWEIGSDRLAWTLRDSRRGANRLNEPVTPPAPTASKSALIELVDGHRTMTLVVSVGQEPHLA